ELLAITISGLVFAVSWTAYPRQARKPFVVLGCGFLGVALLETGHVLSYPGLADYFRVNTLDTSINFWLTARYVDTVAGLIALVQACATKPGVPEKPASAAYSRTALVLTLLLVAAVHVWLLGFPEMAPRSYIDGVGLTMFKKWAEGGIILIHVLMLLLVAVNRHKVIPFQR